MAALKLKELSQKEELLTGGHRMCSGCIAPTAIRQIMLAAEHPVVLTNATGCLEVSTSVYPYSAWKTSWMHSAFENSAATASGIESMYKSLKRQGKIPADQRIDFIAIGGDGGTYDIGLQSLSGAMERNHNMMYVCYDNEAYMNTGIQRSSATPLGGATTTSPAGIVKQGKEQPKKDIMAIMEAHGIPYVAQASPHNWRDLMTKTRKGLNIEGATYLNVLACCHRGWRSKVADSMELNRMAVETCYWPLFEVEHGKLTINYKPKNKRPLVEYMKPQGRFKHLFKPGNEGILETLQNDVDRKWKQLLEREARDQAS